MSISDSLISELKSPKSKKLSYLEADNSRIRYTAWSLQESLGFIVNSYVYCINIRKLFMHRL